MVYSQPGQFLGLGSVEAAPTWDIPAGCPAPVSRPSINSLYGTRNLLVLSPPKAATDILLVCLLLRVCVCAKQSIYSRPRGHLPSFYHFQSVSNCATVPARGRVGALLLLRRREAHFDGSDGSLLMNRTYQLFAFCTGRRGSGVPSLFLTLLLASPPPPRNTSSPRRAPEFTVAATSSEFSLSAHRRGRHHLSRC